MSRRQRPLVAWYGDLDFMPHISAFVSQGAVDAVVSYGEPITAAAITDRKTMTRKLHGAVRRLMASALRGRTILPSRPEPVGQAGNPAEAQSVPQAMAP
jgi:1-acyl-sn-glycerol-3-phosphate acyltransferase